ncbi:efflux RND transporter periplasmic adaptor subunit [Carboxylicivirga linearis]|uniref:HlyD family efflux transporter periplasmic adaptor subunit n=1 Tax=Carboxylicivirga linearis TaxID=1628157 RepID=A0ABS5K2T2_9BACT|nr:HlyD family efflux transporter periplasmic adaptor subunit [Carboxylicivirga linearis]MBS2100966.1 HlyD family efflux transporter periplasmic adaptor subunit [Carboxylicivirga linearis]
MVSKLITLYNQLKSSLSFLVFINFLLVFTSCSQFNTDSDSETIIHCDVKTIHPRLKNIDLYREYQGITQFTGHIGIRAKSSGIICSSFVQPGEYVKENQPLFIIKSRESEVLRSSFHGDEVLSQIADTIYSSFEGIIDQVLIQSGDYVQEGDVLAKSVTKESLHVVVSVPVEEDINKIQNNSCSIILPDNRIVCGTIKTMLPIANYNDQTNQFLIYPESEQRWPENVHVKVRIKDKEINKGIFVPVSSVYSNEELTKYWILRVIKDSVAVKVPIQKGIEIDSLIQIISDNISLSDDIVLEGGYGLSDSSYVNIIQ